MNTAKDRFIEYCTVHGEAPSPEEMALMMADELEHSLATCEDHEGCLSCQEWYKNQQLEWAVKGDN